MKKKITKLILSGLFLLFHSATFADWDPEELQDVDLSVLQDPKYLALKAQTIQTLKGSWCSEEKVNLLMDLVTAVKPLVCVEIGAFTGSSILPVASALKFLEKGQVYAVDGWDNRVATRYWSDTDPNKAWWSTLDMQWVRNEFRNRIANQKLRNYCVEVALPAEAAVSQFDSIDFLHLDGDHSEKGSLMDVELYLPKVKSGGYILLSNLFIMVNGKQPKMKAFCALLDGCEIVADIERDNTILFRKY